MSPGEVCISKVCTLQLGEDEPRSLQPGSPQNGSLQMGLLEVRLLHFSMEQDRIL
jgi:hypothetical protein